MSIVFDTRINVFPDPDYHYEISVSDEQLNLTYHEGDDDHTRSLNFGSIEEMQAVAEAMLRAIRTHKGY